MEDLRHKAVFAETVSAGSMSAAAKRLRMTPSAVSQTIRALEARTGIVLLHRSTRKLSLTEAGARCLPHCLRLLEARNAATASLEEARDAPAGELRIAAPVGFAAHVSPALAPVLTEWPSLKLRLIVDDRLIGRGLAGGAAQGGHEPRDEPLALEFVGAGGLRERLQAPVRISTTSQVALQQLCEEGMGIASLFHPDARPALERGSLVRLLPGWRLPSSPVTMVTHGSDGEAAKVRVAAVALKRYFSALPTVG